MVIGLKLNTVVNMSCTVQSESFSRSKPTYFTKYEMDDSKEDKKDRSIVYVDK